MSVAFIDSDTSTAIIDRRPLARHPHLGARHGQRHARARPGRARRRRTRRCRRQPGRFGHERAEQRDVGEPRGVGLPAQLQHDVQRDQRGDDEQREQPQRGLEGHRDAPPLPARRRSATKRTTSISQSRSVRSCRCPAPARRSVGGDLRPLRRGALRRTAPGTRRCRWAPPASGRVSGSTTVEQPDVGQLELARIDDLDRQQFVPGRQPAQRALQSARRRRPRKSDIDDDQARGGAAAGAASPAPRPGHRAVRRLRARRRDDRRSSRSAASRPGIAG